MKIIVVGQAGVGPATPAVSPVTNKTELGYVAIRRSYVECRKQNKQQQQVT